jgi:hypothetical protein
MVPSSEPRKLTCSFRKRVEIVLGVDASPLEEERRLKIEKPQLLGWDYGVSGRTVHRRGPVKCRQEAPDSR